MNILLIFYIFLLVIIFFYSLNSFYLLLQYRKKKSLEPKRKEPEKTYTVTIQLPVYNEYYVVERLINSVCSIEYPRKFLEIQVLDDSDDETRFLIDNIVEKKRSQGIDIKIIRRDSRKGFKAGALRNGLKFARGEFIVIFDSDFIPSRDFLKQTLPYFSSDKIGMVQTRWGHLNENFSLLTKIQALSLNNHFVIEQTVRNRNGLFINFNGTGGIWRKKCILDAGNWHSDTLAEDVDISYRAQMKGWKFIYLNDFETKAELPSEINALKAQQFRWTKGTVQAAIKLLPKIWKANISNKIKLEATLHLTAHIIFPIILLLILLSLPVLLVQGKTIYNAYFNLAGFFILSMFFTFLFFIYAQKEVYENWPAKIFYFPLFLSGSMGLATNNTIAFFEGIFNRKKTVFERTPKFGEIKNPNNLYKNKYLKRREKDYVLILELIFLLYSFISVVIAIIKAEYTAIFFLIIYFLGFTSVFYLSIKTNFIKHKEVKNG